jgi:hypothetical protein
MISDTAFEPDSSSNVKLASAVSYCLSLGSSGLIEFSEIQASNLEEDVIVYPLGDGPKALGSHDVSPCICYPAIYAST